MPLSSGEKLGPYEIISPIGAGGMGEVYRARDARLGRDVALKILSPEFAGDPQRRQRFEFEARAVAALNHPNIVAVYDVGEGYIVSELVDGEPLGGGQLGLRTAIEIAVQVASGLAAAHDARIVHRDLKPGNIMLTRDGRPKILDFGLAKAMPRSAAADETLTVRTAAGVVMGTPGYMSPEQIRGADTDHRSDIFSFGVILHELLTGKRAFQGETAVDTMQAILRQEVAELPETVPAGVRQIVAHCLEKDAARRFQSAHDLAFALQSLAAGSASAPALASSPPSRRRYLRLAASAAILAAALAATWILAARASRRDPPRIHMVTFRRGLISGARFANDGKTIVYSAAWDGNAPELFSTQEGSPESRPLGIRNAHVAAISRTGEMALILSPQPGFSAIPTVGTLARVPVSGGAPREISENVAYADWSPDGTQLAVVRQLGGGQVLEYPLGKPIYQSAGFIGMPKISPRGDLLAFIDSPNADWYGAVVVLDTKGGKRMSAPLESTAWGFAWSPDGREIRFSGADSGFDAAIKAIDLAGKVRTIVPLAGFHILMDGASDGRLLVVRDGASAAVYFHRPGAAAADLYWHDISLVRDLSADGSQILSSEAGASTTTDMMTYLRPTSGSPAVLLGLGAASALSPDGRWAMLTPAGPKSPLVAFPTRAGSTQTLAAGEIHHFAGRWLPGGKRIVFAGSEPGRLIRYYVQDSPSSPPRPISGENIAFDRYMDPIAISPAGAQVAAIVEGTGIELLPIDGGKSQPVPGTAGLAPVAWCGDGGILMYRPEQIPAEVVRVDPQTGVQRPWKTILPANPIALGRIGPIRFTPDCQTYAYTAIYDPSTLLVVSGAR